VGPNGAGKSTLLRIAAGVLPFDEGERTPGHNVTVGFFAQHQLESLEPTDRVLASLERVAGIRDHPRLRSHLGAFLFPGEDVEKRVEVLSGGEKARLALARMLLRPANFLVLDEPTNHLDLEACEVLETALRAYAGTLLFISHDRAFIDVLATRIVEVRAGELLDFPGSYSDYEHSLEARAQPREEGSAAGAPATKRERIAARERGRDHRRRLERGRKRVTVLEQEITAFESDLEALGWRLGDPEIHRNGDAVRALEVERETLRSALAERYRDWERGAAEVEVLESEDE
jgi:ATP-binding cassette subfamily F protein 3